MVLTGDALLVGDAGRPDLHAHGGHTVDGMARALYRSLMGKLLALPDDLVVYPAHYAGSVCGRGLSATPVSTLGFERRNNKALFGLLVAVNAFVGAMVGLERSTLPGIGREDFGVSSSTAVVSFIIAFGLAKAFSQPRRRRVRRAHRITSSASRRAGRRREPTRQAARRASPRGWRTAGISSRSRCARVRPGQCPGR